MFGVGILGSVSAQEENSQLPDWVRNIFVWYADDEISESELLGAIEYLVDECIVNVKSCDGVSNLDFIVPEDSAKYGPTNNFEKPLDSVFYPLLNEKYSEYYVFEDFEETVYLPGLTLTNGKIVENKGVDADDGKINGNSNGGKSYFISGNSIIFDFDESGVSSFPNYFGLVLVDFNCEPKNGWYNYTTKITYKMFSDGPSPKIEDSFSFGSKDDHISEDTFVGFFNKDGISSVELEAPPCSNSRLQIDHVQYGFLK